MFLVETGEGRVFTIANNGGGPVVSGLLISPWIYALDGETGQSRTPSPETRLALADAMRSLADTADALRRLAQILETPSRIEFESD